MTSSKNTKRALLASVLSVVLCCAMLVGSTFAWFTDSVTSGGNKIQAGNLDIEVEYTLDGTEWAKLDEATNLFGDGLFEPGYTRVVAFRISNKGNLALKYNMSMNLISEKKGVNKAGKEFALSDYLKVKTSPIQEANDVGDIMVSIAFDRDASKAIGWDPETNFKDAKVMANDKILYAGQQVYFIMQVYMPESVGNEANARSIDEAASISFGLNVVATQVPYEKDSFDNTYDKDATYPVIAYNQQQVNDAITNAADKKANIFIASGETITLDNGIANEGDKSRDITFSGDGSQTVDVITNAVSAEGGQLNYQRGSSFTFENLTIEAGEGNFDGIVCDELTFKNCTIKGKLTLYGKATFINCVFENTMDNQYSIWTWGGTDVTFEKCTFNTNGKAILLYGSANTNLVVNNCTFNDRNNGTAGKAAIEIGNDYNATYTLTVNNATVNGFADGKNTGSKLWANKNSMDAAHLTVIIDGNKVL